MTMTMAQNAVAVLNGITLEQYRDTNWWDDVVIRLDGFDWDATDELDAQDGYRSRIVAFRDGSRCEYDEADGKWIAR